MLQANALTGKRPSLAALVEPELGWRISKEQQVSDWARRCSRRSRSNMPRLTLFLFTGSFRCWTARSAGKAGCVVYELMRDAQLPIARMQLNGCYFDRVAQ